MVEWAEIFQRHGPAYRARVGDRMPPSPLAAMAAMEQCRTEARGGHVSPCPDCGAREDSDHACKNRHCPKGQHAAATRWLEQPRALLLPVPSFLVPFPRPEAWRPGARSSQHCLYTLRFQTSAAALQALALDPHDLGGQIGCVGLLPTWTRAMAYHPHVHSLVPGGALSPEDSQGRSPRSAAWLVPVRALSPLFRGQCKAALTPAGLRDAVPPQVWHKAWVTPCAPAGTGTAVLTSFAPSISRIAITTNRLETLEDGHVTFRFQQRRGAGGKRLTLPAAAFLHRFLPPVLPRGCSTVRSSGFLRPSRRQGRPQLKARLAASPGNAPAGANDPHRDPQQTRPAPEQPRRGRTCGGPRVFRGRLAPNSREPPS